MKPGLYRAGAPVKIGWPGYHHYAIVSDRRFCGKPMLISLSFRSGTVAEEPWDVVARGRRVSPSGLQSSLPRAQVIRRARAQIGQARYNLLTNNCEHFVRDVLGLPRNCRQLQAAVGVGASALLLALRLAGGHPAVAVAATVAGLLGGARFSAR